MAVVINEFEALPAAAPAPAGAGGDSAGAAAPRDKIEPCAVAAALRSLEVQALRVWAH